MQVGSKVKESDCIIPKDSIQFVRIELEIMDYLFRKIQLSIYEWIHAWSNVSEWFTEASIHYKIVAIDVWRMLVSDGE